MLLHDEPSLGSPGLYIDGNWVHPAGGGTRQIYDPADGTVIAVVGEADRADAVRAVAAARVAFDEGRWAATTTEERAALLVRLAGLPAGHRACAAARNGVAQRLRGVHARCGMGRFRTLGQRP